MVLDYGEAKRRLVKQGIISSSISGAHISDSAEKTYDDLPDTFLQAPGDVATGTSWMRFEITSSYVTWVWMQNRHDCCGESLDLHQVANLFLKSV